MNKLSVSKPLLISAIKKLSGVVDKKNILPVTHNVLFRVSPSNLEVVGTNIEYTIVYRIVVQSEESFEALVPFEFLAKIVGLLSTEVIDFTFYPKKVVINSGLDVFDIPIANAADEFPKIAAVSEKQSMQLDKRIIDSLNLACITTNTDPLNKFNYVLLDFSQAEKLTVVSCTGSAALYSMTFEIANGMEAMCQVMISQKHIKLFSAQEFTKLYFNKKSVVMECALFTVYATRCQHKYPDYDMLFPSDLGGLFVVNKNELQTALEKCAVANSGFSATTFGISDTICTLNAKSDFIAVEASVPCTYNGTVPSICLGADTLLKLLAQCPCEYVNLHIVTKEKGCVITSDDAPGFKSLIAPIKSMS